MNDGLEAMLGAVGLAFVGGVAINLTNKMLNVPEQKRKRKPFDRQAYKDNRRDIGFGDFSNLGW